MEQVGEVVGVGGGSERGEWSISLSISLYLSIYLFYLSLESTAV